MMNLLLGFSAHILTILHAITLLVFLGHLSRQRKSPASSVAWFLAVLLLPYVGLIFYIFFGIRKLSRTKWQRQIPAPLTDHTPFTAVQKVMLETGCKPPSLGNHVRILSSGEEAYRQILKLIDRAKSSILIETFIFSNDEVGREIVKHLTRAAERGVEVCILIDAFGGRYPFRPRFTKLRKAGGKTRLFMPLIHLPFRGHANLRNHRKLLVVDESHALLGGMNLATEYMGPTGNSERWVDLAFLVEGPAVHEFCDLFHHDWAYAGGASLDTPLRTESPTPIGPHRLQVAPSGPDYNFDVIQDALLTAFFMAQKRIWIATPYFIPGDALTKAVELALHRGIEVRLLVPYNSNHKIADVARTTYLAQLSDHGAEIYYYPKMIHAKAVLIDDDFALVGSANMDNRSLLINFELGMALYSLPLNAELCAWFSETFAECSNTAKEPRWFHDWTAGMVRLLEPIL